MSPFNMLHSFFQFLPHLSTSSLSSSSPSNQATISFTSHELAHFISTMLFACASLSNVSQRSFGSPEFWVLLFLTPFLAKYLILRWLYATPWLSFMIKPPAPPLKAKRSKGGLTKFERIAFESKAQFVSVFNEMVITFNGIAQILTSGATGMSRGFKNCDANTSELLVQDGGYPDKANKTKKKEIGGVNFGISNGSGSGNGSSIFNSNGGGSSSSPFNSNGSGNGSSNTNDEVETNAEQIDSETYLQFHPYSTPHNQSDQITAQNLYWTQVFGEGGSGGDGGSVGGWYSVETVLHFLCLPVYKLWSELQYSFGWWMSLKNSRMGVRGYVKGSPSSGPSHTNYLLRQQSVTPACIPMTPLAAPFHRSPQTSFAEYFYFTFIATAVVFMLMALAPPDPFYGYGNASPSANSISGTGASYLYYTIWSNVPFVTFCRRVTATYTPIGLTPLLRITCVVMLLPLYFFGTVVFPFQDCVYNFRAGKSARSEVLEDFRSHYSAGRGSLAGEGHSWEVSANTLNNANGSGNAKNTIAKKHPPYHSNIPPSNITVTQILQNPPSNFPPSETYSPTLLRTNRLKLICKTVILRVIEDLVLCILVPHSIEACVFSGRCISPTSFSYPSMTPDASGETPIIPSSWEWGCTDLDRSVNKKIEICIAISLFICSNTILLCQALEHNRSYLAEIAAIAGEWENMDPKMKIRNGAKGGGIGIGNSSVSASASASTSSSSAKGGIGGGTGSNRNSIMSWDKDKKYKVGDLILEQYPYNNVYRCCTPDPKARPSDVFLRATFDMFRNEISPLNIHSYALATLTKLHLAHVVVLGLLAVVVFCIDSHVVTVTCVLGANWIGFSMVADFGILNFNGLKREIGRVGVGGGGGD